MMGYQVITDPEEEDHFAIAIQHRIVQGAETGAHIPQPGHLAVQHIEQTSEQDEGPCPADIGQIPPLSFFGSRYKNDGYPDIQQQPDRRHHIGGQTRPDQ